MHMRILATFWKGLKLMIVEAVKGVAIFISLAIVWVCLNVWFGG